MASLPHLVNDLWLLFPTASAGAHAMLVMQPEALLAWLPALWQVKRPSHTKGMFDAEAMFDDWLSKIDSRRTAYDRWGTRIIFATLYGVPLLVLVKYCCWPHAKRWATSPPRWLLRLLEPVAYGMALAVSAQSCRYSPEDADAAASLGLLGAVAFGPCWLFSAVLHGGVSDTTGMLATLEKYTDLFLSTAWLAFPLFTIVLASIALVHKDQVTGLLATAAVHSWASAGLASLNWPAAAHGEKEEAAQDSLLGRVATRWAVTSLALMAVALTLGSSGFAGTLRPFTLGAVCCGHVAYLGSTVLLASQWGQRADTYYLSQLLALASCCGAFLLGRFWASPGLSGAGYSGLVLWLLTKEFEVSWANLGMKLIATYGTVGYLLGDPELLMAIPDSRNLYS